LRARRAAPTGRRFSRQNWCLWTGISPVDGDSCAGSVGICHGPNGLAVGPVDRSIEKELHVQVFVRDNNVDQGVETENATRGRVPRDEAPWALRKTLREASPGKSGSCPSRPEARSQKVAARRSAADEAACSPGGPRNRWPRAQAPFLIWKIRVPRPRLDAWPLRTCSGFGVDGGDS
jgi:hypothetical protein